MKKKTKIKVEIKGEPNYEVIKKAAEQFYYEVMMKNGTSNIE